MFNRNRFKVRRGGNNTVTSISKGSYQDYDNHGGGGVGGSSTSSPLANFDACVEACDAIAASSGNSIGVAGKFRLPMKQAQSDGHQICTTNGEYRRSKSIMISPDGELLSCIDHGHPDKKDDIEENSIDTRESEVNDDSYSSENRIGTKDTKSNPTKDDNKIKTFTEAKEDEFESSIYVGNDVVPDGEKVLNGFSARGWNPVMTTMAIRRAVDTLQ